MKTITELTIVRSKWLRGEGCIDSRLLRPEDGKMCCLGHFSLACGATEEQIYAIESPIDLIISKKVVIPQLVETSRVESLGVGTKNYIINHAAKSLMENNDATHINDREREAAIKELMLQLDPPVKVTFVD